jgi:hypothetical protein
MNIYVVVLKNGCLNNYYDGCSRKIIVFTINNYKLINYVNFFLLIYFNKAILKNNVLSVEYNLYRICIIFNNIRLLFLFLN